MTVADDFYDLFKKQDQRPPGDRPLAAVPDVPAGSSSSYAAAALRREAEAVATAANGTRNDTLNKAAFRLGRHVGAGSIDARTVRTVLEDAARQCGLPQDEIDLVLRDNDNGGLAQGQAVPRYPTPQAPLPDVTVLQAGQAGEIDPEIGPPLNPIIDWHELFATEDEDEEWIIEPLLPARRMVALYSAPKAGKSLLMLEIAVAIAAGTHALGNDVEQARRVLYVDFENDPRGDVKTRLEAMEVGPGQLDGLCYLTFPSLAKFDTPQGALDLIRHVKHYDCEVVVIDTVSRAVAGEENENDTWLAFYRNTGLTLKQHGIACIRLDHSGKDKEKGMRGGSAKYGDVDAVWRLSPIGEDMVHLECTDHRMPVPTKTITLKRQTYPLVHTVAGDILALSDARTREVDEQLDRLRVPNDASTREAGKALREAGHSVNSQALRQAVKLRKLRLDMPTSEGDLSVPGTPAAHLGTPQVSVPGTPPPKGAAGTPAAARPAHPKHTPSGEASGGVEE